jgi:glycosyltransferase involved in cell wall biosynthesis
MRLSIISNLAALKHVDVAGVEVDLIAYPGGKAGFLKQSVAFYRAFRCDYAVINCSPRDLYWFCLLKLFFPFSRCRIVSLDTVLPVPTAAGVLQGVGLALKKTLFKRVHLFIEYFRETSGYEKYYGIARPRFRYVPFKINRYEKVLQTATRDEGYIFCGGNTRRDFATLIEATQSLAIPVRIVTRPNAIIGDHGSFIDERHLPPHINVVRHDGSDSFLDHIAAARLVVLPIKRDNISASGIGVYLACMALGKCVIISEGPAVNGIVPSGAAVVVPPEDPAALRAAIDRVLADDRLRVSIAEAGQRYALSLGGEQRLCESVLGVLVADAREIASASAMALEG